MQRSSALYGVSFGKDDAAMEAKQGFLKEVFLKTSFYHRVKAGQKFLVTGRKGSGKSAICLSLQTALEAEGKTTIFATSKLLSMPKIQQIKGTSINDQDRFETSWRYVFLVKISIELLKNIDSRDYDFDFLELNADERQKLKEVRSFLVQNNEINKNFGQKLASFVNVFSKFSAKLPGGVEAGVETRQIDITYDLSTMIDRLEICVIGLSAKINDFDLTILVDEIDDIWDLTEESRPLIIGLLNAIRKLNSSFASNIVILAFLRSDIWDALSFSDKDKFRSEDERISWSNEDLKKLIAARAKMSAKLTEVRLDEVDRIWEIIFESHVNKQDSFGYIVDRTLKRPREIIQFCNLALSIAQDNSRMQIQQEDIKAAESRYSTWKLDDLVNEFKVQYPFLKDFLVIFQGFEETFSKHEIDMRYKNVHGLLLNRLGAALLR
jgi:energy-coupling factor transporter ATP-binding protein EcfA2